MRVLITSPWASEFAQEAHRDFPQIELIVPSSPAEAMIAAPDAEVAIGAVSRDLFLVAEQLKWIQSSSAGVEWMAAIPELADSEVIVTNTRGAHAVTIAEHTMGMLVFLARGFGQLYVAQQNKTWQRPGPHGVGLAGLTMGIIGLGNIGRAIAHRAHAFDMRVIAVDAHEVPQPETVAHLSLLDGLPALMAEADVVVVATPITDRTRGMVGPGELKLMKHGSFLLVVSRGGIVDEEKVVEMLHSGHLAGAGLDVTAVEPLPPDNPLWTAPNVFITPHCSPSSHHTRHGVIAIIRDNLRRYLAGEPLTNVVDKRLGY